MKSVLPIHSTAGDECTIAHFCTPYSPKDRTKIRLQSKPFPQHWTSPMPRTAIVYTFVAFVFGSPYFLYSKATSDFGILFCFNSSVASWYGICAQVCVFRFAENKTSVGWRLEDANKYSGNLKSFEKKKKGDVTDFTTQFTSALDRYVAISRDE